VKNKLIYTEDMSKKTLAIAIILAVFFIIFTQPVFAQYKVKDLDTEVFFFRTQEVELPIIMYHLITERPKYLGKYGITPEELESDLAYLKENDYETVVVQDLINFVNQGEKLPKKPIMLTFDDGNASDFLYLLPLLEKYEMKAVLAVLGGAADKYTAEAESNPNARYPNLTWPQIKELHESGLAEIQSHSYGLHNVPIGSGKKRGESNEAYKLRFFDDLKKFQDACAAQLDYSPTAFIYPLGVIGDGSREVLEELGMSASISCQEGMNIIRQGDKDCLFSLLRTNRPSGRSVEDILRKLQKNH